MNRSSRLMFFAVFVVCLVALGFCCPLLTQDEPGSGRLRFEAAAGSPFAVGPMTHKLVVADMNGDGSSDVVLTCGGETDSRPDPQQGFVAILVNDKGGALRRAHQLVPIGLGGLKSAAGDLNNDGRKDIVAIAHDSYLVHILLQFENGQFDAEHKREVFASRGDQPHTHEIVLSDVNADGNLDILTTNEDDGNVSVLLGDGLGDFEPARGSPFAAGQHPYEGLSLSDLNGDRHLDLAVPNVAGHAVTVLLGNGTGQFAASEGSPFAVGQRPGFIAIGDLNGDNAPDIVATHDDDPIVFVLIGDGRGGFRPSPNSPITLKENVWGAVVADMDADGKNDVVLGGKADELFVLMGDGRGEFEKDMIEVPIEGHGPYNIGVSDMNGDGKLDLISSNYESGNVSVVLQQ